MIGSLVYNDYKDLFKKNRISTTRDFENQIQPSSIDLSLSEECYEIKCSFLSSHSKVRDKLDELVVNKINLNHSKIFKKNKTYLVRLNEFLNLENNVKGYCNPKSSTGRLDIFCRTILDNCDEYEKIPSNYQGEMFIEITTRSFDVEFIAGDKLNQMRLVYKKNYYIEDNALRKINDFDPIIYNSNLAIIDNGLKISVDLSTNNNICSYRAKENTPVLNFSKVNYHDKNKYWDELNTKNNCLIIERNKFYILKSKEKIRIPKNMAGEMIPYDTGIGDFRVHYAGFFDPGFGDPGGSYAVLEVKTQEVPFLLEDGQTIARIKYEKLNKNTSVVYGTSINSNYQNQKLALSKHFIC
ncbi:MAG: Deoxycytidine triphosphate deaminase [Alphaproteobacteria bacterium MarineAlpha5_Bin4]|nr:MAG: Deoxycytidine triphosphate deaminase [Alphaproteobacteria bacterium MarineAlpha5_Bin4]